MALLDFLKNKKEKEKTKEKKTPRASVTKKAENTEKMESVSAKSSGVSKKGFSYNVIKEPHISEKATGLAEENKYTFKVYSGSNKHEVKKSVEGVYGVDVLDVNIIKIPPKKRRLGRTEGFKKAFTKAIVRIKDGQKIELF